MIKNIIIFSVIFMMCSSLYPTDELDLSHYSYKKRNPDYSGVYKFLVEKSFAGMSNDFNRNEYADAFIGTNLKPYRISYNFNPIVKRSGYLNLDYLILEQKKFRYYIGADIGYIPSTRMSSRTKQVPFQMGMSLALSYDDYADIYWRITEQDPVLIGFSVNAMKFMVQFWDVFLYMTGYNLAKPFLF